MKTIEQIFCETKGKLAEQMEDAVHSAMDKIYSEYLPYVENDTASNVYFRTTDLIQRFFNDTLTEEDCKMPIFHEYYGKDARKKALEENKEVIAGLINRDLILEIVELREILNSYTGRY